MSHYSKQRQHDYMPPPVETCTFCDRKYIFGFNGICGNCLDEDERLESHEERRRRRIQEANEY